MAKPKRIDLELLDEMLSEKTGEECAEYFDVSRAAISQAKKKLKKAVVSHTAIHRAPVVVDKHLDIIGQLNKINKDTQKLVDLCMAWTRGDLVAIQILETQKRKICIGSKEDGTEEWVSEYKFKDPRELALKGMVEIRNQLKFQADLFKQL
jgi:hypothetical protein